MDAKCLEYKQHNVAAKLERKQSGIWHYIARKRKNAGRDYG
jgi:hypothetical protein